MYNQKEFMSVLEMRNPSEPEFIQAVNVRLSGKMMKVKYM